MTRPTKPVAMSFVRIGFVDLLLPSDAGLKLIALLQSAVECDRRYDGGNHYKYIPRTEVLSVEFALVHASQLQAPGYSPTRSRGPLLLENGQ